MKDSEGREEKKPTREHCGSIEDGFLPHTAAVFIPLWMTALPPNNCSFVFAIPMAPKRAPSDSCRQQEGGESVAPKMMWETGSGTFK